MFAKLLVSLALIFSAPVPHAWAGPKTEKPEPQCPHALSEFDKIGESADKAPRCSAALALFGACSVGASSDVRLGGAVLARCERDFLKLLNKAQTRSYRAEQARCERKYSRREGSMYRSAEAFCLAEIAAKYAKRFAKAAGPPKK